ncbi:ABC transporter ATP-binding protein [Anaerotruncus colihominis]|uniref:ABC transporter ATP-binding protein n=1 Tax=Anaerotruncus colihominis TaxID=169435 RepID=UPI0026713DBF|nr:ABC transporter ATP-binding protein [Anaerotruncus colihominis]
MIEAQNLVKCFGDFTALSSLTTSIPRGSVYGLVGSNGSGKSTFLRLCAGVYMPDGGSIAVDGQKVYENTAVKQTVFFIADDLYFLPQSSLRDMARFYAQSYPGYSQERFERLLGVFPLDPAAKLATFSKGMKRQAALVLALACRPKLLLLDEAFDGLDPVARGAARRLLSDGVAEYGMTVLITSHNLRELEDLCDHVGLLHRGHILFEREIDELRLGFCKVQAVFPQGVSDETLRGLDVLQSSRSGSMISLVVRGSSDSAAGFLLAQGAVFAEGVPLTLEEVFIHEMEAVGYDYNSILF